MWAKELNNWTMLCLYTKLPLKRNKTLTRSLSFVCSIAMAWVGCFGTRCYHIVDAATATNRYISPVLVEFVHAFCLSSYHVWIIDLALRWRCVSEKTVSESEWMDGWVDGWESGRNQMVLWLNGWLTGMCLKMCSNSQHNGQWFTRHLIIRDLPLQAYSFFSSMKCYNDDIVCASIINSVWKIVHSESSNRIDDKQAI